MCLFWCREASNRSRPYHRPIMSDAAPRGQVQNGPEIEAGMMGKCEPSAAPGELKLELEVLATTALRAPSKRQPP